jgi:DNA-directed RNA polymerase sigma subunit (sigma70/sigma32)
VVKARAERAYACAPMTLEQVGRAMNISRELVRRIESKALDKVTARLAERGLTLDDLLGQDRARGIRGRSD